MKDEVQGRSGTDADLLAFIDSARNHVMTPNERYEQRRSFLRGMCPSHRDYADWCAQVDKHLPPLDADKDGAKKSDGGVEADTRANETAKALMAHPSPMGSRSCDEKTIACGVAGVAPGPSDATPAQSTAGEPCTICDGEKRIEIDDDHYITCKCAALSAPVGEPDGYLWRTRRPDNSNKWAFTDTFSPSLMESVIEFKPIYFDHPPAPAVGAEEVAASGLLSLVLEMGAAIRKLDENNEYLEFWKQDDRYIIDGRYPR